MRTISPIQTKTKPKFSFPPTQTDLLQRKCASCGQHTITGGECSECQKKRSFLQRRSTNQSGHAEAPPIVHEVLRASGQLLDTNTRTFMEPRFGQEFSRVRTNTAPKRSQTQLSVSLPGARYEREADRIAAIVMRMPEPTIQQQVGPEEEEDEKLIQTKLLTTPLIQRRVEEAKDKEDTPQAQELSSRSPEVTPNFASLIRPLREGGQDVPIIMRTPSNNLEPLAERFSLTNAQLSLSARNTLEPSIVRVESRIFAMVYFSQNSFVLDAPNYAIVKQLSEELRFMSDPTVTVDGYTSTEGTEEHNLELSKNRRQTVIDILSSQLRGKTVNFKGTFHGELSPFVAETGKSGSAELENQRARNRRVFIQIAPSPTPIDIFPPEVFEEAAAKGPEEKKSSLTICSALASRPFDEQPDALKIVLNASFKDAATWFKGLDQRRGLILTSIYNRLCKFRLWHHVRSVGQIQISPDEKFYFTSHDNKAFWQDLISSSSFCVDAINVLHGGESCVREISTGDSLHICVGSGNNCNTHIDGISPVADSSGVVCVNDPTRAAAHIGREAVPGEIKKLLKKGIPLPFGLGRLPSVDLPPNVTLFEIFPEETPTGKLPEQDEPPPSLVEIIKFRF